MNTPGKSGTHETDMFNQPNTTNDSGTGTVKETGKADTTETRSSERAPMSPPTNEEAGRAKKTGNPGGAEEAVVIEVLTQEPGRQTRSPDSRYFAEDMPTSGFRWWYIAAPVAAVTGATVTTVVLLQRRRQRALKAAEIAAAAKATRNWLEAMRVRQTLAQASGLIQQGVQRSRNPVEKVQARRNFWSDLVTDPIVAWRDLATGSVAAWRDLVADSVTGWRDLTTASVGRWSDLVTGSVTGWRDLTANSADRWRRLALSRAQPYVHTARSQAVTTKATASRAANNIGKTVNGTISHTLVFSLGALVTAAATYVFRWRQRMVEAETTSQRTDVNVMREQPIL